MLMFGILKTLNVPQAYLDQVMVMFKMRVWKLNSIVVWKLGLTPLTQGGMFCEVNGFRIAQFF